MAEITGYIGAVEDGVIRLIQEATAAHAAVLGSFDVYPSVEHYAGEANTPDGISELVGRVAEGAKVMVSFARRASGQGASTANLRSEALELDIFVAASNYRSREDQVRAAYPLIELVDVALLGKRITVLDAEHLISARESDGGNANKIVEVPGLVVFQMPFTIAIRRRL